MAAAAFSAWILAPIGASLAVNEFAQQTGLQIAGPLADPAIQGMLAGLYTLLTWHSFIAIRTLCARSKISQALPSSANPHDRARRCEADVSGRFRFALEPKSH